MQSILIDECHKVFAAVFKIQYHVLRNLNTYNILYYKYEQESIFFGEERGFVMKFWIFMFCCNLVVPCIMLAYGAFYLRCAAEKINWERGYRSKRSVKSQEAWNFANRYSGKLWCGCGAVLLCLTVLAMIWLYGTRESQSTVIGGIICIAQCLVMLLSIFPTEMALKRKFGD